MFYFILEWCPLLNVFGFCTTSPTVDKFLFTKFYAAPPTMTNALVCCCRTHAHHDRRPFCGGGLDVDGAVVYGADADDGELLLGSGSKRIDHANVLMWSWSSL